MGTIGVVEATFVAGLELNAAYYREVVEPLVRPFGHAAALFVDSTDVLSYPHRSRQRRAFLRAVGE